MKNRVTIKVTESAELTVNITEKMVADYNECKSMAEQRDCDGKECRTCSLDTYEHLGIGLCGIPEVVKAIEENAMKEKYKTCKHARGSDSLRSMYFPPVPISRWSGGWSRGTW